MHIHPLIVSSFDTTGGAARAAHRLTQALREQDVDAVMWVGKKVSDKSYVLGPETRYQRALESFLPRLGRMLTTLQKTSKPKRLSANCLPGLLFRRIEESDANVVNFHWINDETLTIKQIGRMSKPVVFTLHDMWAFCGAEHLAPDNGLSRFRQGYLPGNRPKDEAGLDIDRWTWNRKRKYWQKQRHVICPSTWLARCARESALMRDWPIHVIPNVLDVRQYLPLDKTVSRQALGLPSDIPLIAFGDAGGGYNKGFDFLIDALHCLAGEKGLSDVECVIFGQRQTNRLPNLGIPVHFIGRLHDNCALALLFNAVDVVVVPSLQESFSQVASESHACGTPVVAFNTTGLQDVVVHETTGYLAEPFVAEDLAKGIYWVLTDRSRHNRMSVAARERACRLWSSEIVIPQYLDIYKRAIDAC